MTQTTVFEASTRAFIEGMDSEARLGHAGEEAVMSEQVAGYIEWLRANEGGTASYRETWLDLPPLQVEQFLPLLDPPGDFGQEGPPLTLRRLFTLQQAQIAYLQHYIGLITQSV